jgi:hypothetical protein
MSALTTSARVKARLALGGEQIGDQYDTWIGYAIAAYTRLFERMTHRLVEATSRTAVFDVDGRTQTFFLPGVPVSSITSIKNDPDRAFGSGTEVDSDDYRLEDAAGLVVVDQTVLSIGRGALQIVYVGGLGADADAVVAAYPDLAFAVEEQIAYHRNRLSSPGKTGASQPAGGVSFSAALGLLPLVKETFEEYQLA